MFERSRRPDTCTLVVCRSEDGAIVGVYNMSQIFRRLFRARILATTLEPSRGKGYLSEGLELVLPRASSG